MWLNSRKNSEGIAVIACRVCEASYKMAINGTFSSSCPPFWHVTDAVVALGLTEPVDVYCDWIDACEDVNAEHME